jgi:hypothetical protein
VIEDHHALDAFLLIVNSGSFVICSLWAYLPEPFECLGEEYGVRAQDDAMNGILPLSTTNYGIRELWIIEVSNTGAQLEMLKFWIGVG